MEHVEYLSVEEVLRELIKNIDQSSYLIGNFQIRYTLELADKLGIKFYRTLAVIN